MEQVAVSETHLERLGTGAATGSPQGSPSLDRSTQLVSRRGVEQSSGWWLTTYPDCAEATLIWRHSTRGRSIASPAEAWLDDQARQLAEEWRRRERLSRPEEPRLDRSVQAANARAAAKSRRYFVANRLRFMWVLTFRESAQDRRQVMGQVAALARRIRLAWPEGPLPYWYSPELHPGGHGWHVNLFVASRLPQHRVEGLWGHGYVWVTDFATAPRTPKGERLGLCRTPREGWRRAAAYGCKYAQKDWGPGSIGPRDHRYEVAQGYAPEKQTRWVASKAEATGIVAQLLPDEVGGAVEVWDSNDDEGWDGPPVMTWRW